MELESALSDWDSLSLKGGKGKPAKRPGQSEAKTAQSQSDKEFRKKTKKLLLQLRQQLADLED